MRRLHILRKHRKIVFSTLKPCSKALTVFICGILCHRWVADLKGFDFGGRNAFFNQQSHYVRIESVVGQHHDIESGF